MQNTKPSWFKDIVDAPIHTLICSDFVIRILYFAYFYSDFIKIKWYEENGNYRVLISNLNFHYLLTAISSIILTYAYYRMWKLKKYGKLLFGISWALQIFNQATNGISIETPVSLILNSLLLIIFGIIISEKSNSKAP